MSMKANAEIIAVGSELLLGQIANTNAQFLSKQLAELGVNVYYHTVVGDNTTRLQKTIEIARSRSDLIIFTGGLGPTKDDVTKETIAHMFNRTLSLHQQSMKQIEDYFQKTKRKMSENNRKQAFVISDSYVLPNDHGMAPGMAFQHEGKIWMLLPGPPKEMKPMFLNYGIPYLKDQLGANETITSRVLRFFGIGESQLETEIEDLIDKQSNPTIAPLAKDGEVTLRITAKHHDQKQAEQLLDQMEDYILARVGQYFYGYDETSLPEQILRRLQAIQFTISSAESLTGGLFLQLLTNISGASQVVKGGVVSYTNEVKQQMLHVKKETLQKYGAVSRQCAKEMAENVRTLIGSDIGISFTGVAGPEPLENQSVGTVFVGIATKEKTNVYELHLAGSRDSIRKRTVNYGCYHLMKMLDC
ncbi:competence/damage-inducible protein A [Bacillus alveayuensis]|uniref:competence/damage-inducible protein A n=1 Tax=Aeribacillus alveayuensis TaxID=279215 RepID=UPI003899540D